MSEPAAIIRQWGVTVAQLGTGRWAVKSIARAAGGDGGDAGHASPPLPVMDFDTRDEAMTWAGEFITANL